MEVRGRASSPPQQSPGLNSQKGRLVGSVERHGSAVLSFLEYPFEQKLRNDFGLLLPDPAAYPVSSRPSMTRAGRSSFCHVLLFD